jgi:hypothetical protein
MKILMQRKNCQDGKPVLDSLKEGLKVKFADLAKTVTKNMQSERNEAKNSK